MSTLLKMLLVAAAYFVAGRLSLPMALPAGYATAVWPAAGIALVAVLVLGYRIVPGIALGSFLANLLTTLHVDSQQTLTHAAGPAGIIAFGPVLQACAAAYMVRRFVGYPTALDRQREVARFLLLAGPIGCLISATWGATTLLLTGAIAAHDYAFHWWTWWVGDSIGVLIFAPLLLIFVGEPRDTWRRRLFPIGAPLLVGFMAVTAVFIRVAAWEKERRESTFAHRANALAEALRRETNDCVEVGELGAAFFGVEQHVNCEAFDSFASGSLARHPEIAGLAWIPRVAHSERASYEQSAPQPRIREKAPDGSWAPASPRAEYFPIRCIAPHKAASALAYNLGSDAERARTMRQARDSRAPAATAPVELVQDGRGVVFLVPVFEADGAARSKLAGFFSTAVDAELLFAAALRGLDRRGVVIEAFDQGELGKGRGLYSERQERAAREVGLQKTLDVAGRSWRVHFIPSAAFLKEQRGWQPWVVLAGGLFLLGILGAAQLVITGREARVALAEAKYRDLYENAPAMYLSVAAESSRITACNLTFENALGYAKSELIGRPIADVYHPDSADAARTVYESLRATGTDAESELVLQRKDGSALEVILSASAVRDDDGRVVASRSVFRDISGRKQLERLRERDRFFQLSIDMVCICNDAGYMLEVSPAWEQVLGYTTGELLAKPFLHFVHEDDRAATLREMARLGSGQLTMDFKNRYRHKDGTYRWLQWRAAPDRTGLIYAIARDVTDEFKSELDLRAREKSLQAGLNEREVMLQEIHHRVKNNLQVISSLMNLQMRQLHDTSGKAALEECQRRVQTIALIHEQLYRSGDYARVLFSDYTKRLATNVFHAAGISPSKVSLRLDVEDIRMTVDKAIPCGLILNELIANALEHAFPNNAPGTLRVGLRAAGEREIELSVADDGVGLPALFNQAQASTLGIQLVTTLVSQLDGRLEIERQGGTTFRITFPLEVS